MAEQTAAEKAWEEAQKDIARHDAVWSLESWMPIVGWAGLYEVSSLGRVRSLPRFHVTGGVLKAPVNNSGYRNVALHLNGAGKTRLVHQLVAEAFHGARPDGEEVRHLDGDRLNNCADNLRWGTRSENVQDSLRHGTNSFANRSHCPQGHEYSASNTRTTGSSRSCIQCNREAGRRYRRRVGLKPTPRGEAHKRSKLTEAAVAFIRENYKPRHLEFGQMALAARFGVSPDAIRHVVIGRTWSHTNKKSGGSR